MKKIALITGINGQTGSYLAELLVNKGYIVHGIVRRVSSINTERLNSILDKITLHYGDVTDALSTSNLIAKIQPDEIYNLAAQSHVHVSFSLPGYTQSVDAYGPLVVLESVRVHCPKAKILQSSTSEMFGKVKEIPQSELTAFNPRSPYGISKVFAYWITRNYRDAYKLFASNSICYNHESPRRGRTFVTRKIITELIKIKFGDSKLLTLGNLSAQRDWGLAADFAVAMHAILQHDKPDDFVIATGKTYTIRDFAERTAKKLGMDLIWEGSGLDEIGIDKNTGKTIIGIDPKYYRPTEVDLLIGDPSKAKRELGWESTTTLDELIDIMVKSDLDYYSKYKKFNY